MHGSPPTVLPTNGEAAVAPPQGEFNPPPTEGAHGVLDHILSVRVLSDKFDSRRPFRNVLDTPLYNLSPGALGPPDRSAKLPQLPSLRPLGSIFGTSKTCFKFCFEKTSKKVRKLMILASQNPPQTLPKSIQNRGTQKNAFFSSKRVRFFYFFYLRFLQNMHFT